MSTSACRSCDAPVLWVVTLAGKRMPLDAKPRPDGNVILFGDGRCRYLGKDEGPVEQPRYVSHFATCGQAKEWRRPDPPTEAPAPIALDDGRRVDPETGEILADDPAPPIPADLAERLAAFAEALAIPPVPDEPGTMPKLAWPTPGERRGLANDALRRATALAAERDTLRQRLEDGYGWLERNKGHERFREWEDRWLGWLASYRAIEDALRGARVPA